MHVSAAEKYEYKIACEDEVILETSGIYLSLFQYEKNKLEQGTTVYSNEIKWSVSDESVAKLVDDNQLEAVKEGTVTVTAKYKNITRVKKIKVAKPHFYGNNTGVTAVGQTFTFPTVSGYPELDESSWTIADTSIAKIAKVKSKYPGAEGELETKIKGLKKGTTTLSVITKGGTKVSTKLTVLDPVKLSFTSKSYGKKNGKYAWTIEVKNSGKQPVKIGKDMWTAVYAGDGGGMEGGFFMPEKNVTIKPGKSKKVVLCSNNLSLKEIFWPTLDVTCNGSKFYITFDNNGKKVYEMRGGTQTSTVRFVWQ